jgi:hypothetical protein
MKSGGNLEPIEKEQVLDISYKWIDQYVTKKSGRVGDALSFTKPKATAETVWQEEGSTRNV